MISAGKKANVKPTEKLQPAPAKKAKLEIEHDEEDDVSYDVIDMRCLTPVFICESSDIDNDRII